MTRITKELSKHIFLLASSILFAFPFMWMVFGIFKTNNEIWQEPYKLLPDSFDFTKVLEMIKEIDFSIYMYNSLYMGILGTVAMLIVTILFVYAVVFLDNKFMDGLFFLVLVTYMLPAAVTYVPSYVILARLDLLDSLNGMLLTYLPNVFMAFYLRQSFMKIPKSYIDAAKIDGASDLRILRNVVLPLTTAPIVTVSVLTFIQMYNNYMWPSIIIKDSNKFLIAQGLTQYFIQDGAYGMNWSGVMLACTISILPVILLFIFAQKWFVAGISANSGIKIDSRNKS